MSKLCPKMEATLTLLGKKWNGLIIYTLMDGPKKFGEMEKLISHISARMLTERLKELETEAIIEKQVFPETPVRIVYKLTQKGIDLGNTYQSIGKWAEKWV